MSDREIWRAAHESRHWSFEAFGATADEATEALTRTLVTHQRQTGADPAWLAEAMEDAAEPRRLVLGIGYRDGEVCGPGQEGGGGGEDAT